MKDGQDSKDYIFNVNDLFNAVRYGSWNHIVFIVEQNKSLVEMLDSEGHSCIHWAAKRGDYDILKYLHTAGAALNLPSTMDPRMLPIHWAASDGRIQALKFFIDYRQDINAQDANSCTPVAIATQYNQINTVAFLIKNGADMSLRDCNGDSALHWAAYKGYEELCGLLIHCNPQELNFPDKFGQTPLHLASLRGNHDVVEYLIATHGADYSKRDKNGLNAVDLCIKKNQLKTEWVIRRLTSGNIFLLCANLGMNRLRNKRLLCFLLAGADERDMSLWIWRVSFVSNLTATCINVFYATSEHMTDLYALHLANTVVNFVWWIFFLTTLWKGPGYAVDAAWSKQSSSQQPAAISYDAALEVLGSGQYADLMDHPAMPSLCHTCRVVRPLRSKHCKVARRCVLKFDHFCPYVCNTLGRDNYKFFIGILALHPVAFSLFAVTTFYYMMRVSVSYKFIAFLLYSLGMASMVLCLFFYHAKLVSKNLTTNEDVNKDRYFYLKNEYNFLDNPFDKGSAWANFVDSIFPSEKLYYKRDEVLRDKFAGGVEGSKIQNESFKSNTSSSRLEEEEGFFEESKLIRK
eukprot:CAMPEP_0170094462 /NCGR_PEP_ID=MMETSP0019_2-20121128/27255_1 /TAXON_ID=98059 /ORGANISM="Dinobryon sp., Strain UTEXLB2267" /LENGTH=574 /DNA_ID=CAMNT_0010315767 /DNA_START=662 /DNA_END=2386 /DNA_ORIENTATION=-